MERVNSVYGAVKNKTRARLTSKRTRQLVYICVNERALARYNAAGSATGLYKLGRGWERTRKETQDALAGEYPEAVDHEAESVAHYILAQAHALDVDSDDDCEDDCVVVEPPAGAGGELGPCSSTQLSAKRAKTSHVFLENLPPPEEPAE